MSTNTEILQVYNEDRKYPFYSLQGGMNRKCLTYKERWERWIWGHFAEALQRALENPVKRAT